MYGIRLMQTSVPISVCSISHQPCAALSKTQVFAPRELHNRWAVFRNVTVELVFTTLTNTNAAQNVNNIISFIKHTTPLRCPFLLLLRVSLDFLRKGRARSVFRSCLGFAAIGSLSPTSCSTAAAINLGALSCLPLCVCLCALSWKILRFFLCRPLFFQVSEK